MGAGGEGERNISQPAPPRLREQVAGKVARPRVRDAQSGAGPASVPPAPVEPAATVPRIRDRTPRRPDGARQNKPVGPPARCHQEGRVRSMASSIEAGPAAAPTATESTRAPVCLPRVSKELNPQHGPAPPPPGRRAEKSELARGEREKRRPSRAGALPIAMSQGLENRCKYGRNTPGKPRVGPETVTRRRLQAEGREREGGLRGPGQGSVRRAGPAGASFSLRWRPRRDRHGRGLAASLSRQGLIR